MELKRFEPINIQAKQMITDLVKRGGEVITVRKDFVEIKRQQSVAKIDQHGRVEWRPF
jgi:hypothetical protein